MRIYAAEGGSSGQNYATLYQDPNNIVRGHEYQMQIDARFDPVNGHLDVIRDGVTIVNYNGPLGWTNMGSVYWKEGVYRADAPEAIAMDYNHLSITTGSQPASPPPPVSPPPVSPPPVSPPPVSPPPVSPPPPTSGSGVTLTASGYNEHLTGGAGNDILIASTQGSDTLTGGAGSDTFKFGAMPWTPSHISDFQVGVDKLDLHALYPNYTGSDPIRDGYVSLADDGHGGTNVLVNPDGHATAANPWPTYVVDLDNVARAGLTSAQLFGGSTTPISPPPASPPPVSPPPPTSGGGVTLTGTGYNDNLVGGAGNDTLIASVPGSGTMTGGAGADIFRFGKMPWTPSHITDFQVGIDKLDLHGLYPTYTGSNPVRDGYVTLADDGHGGTNVLVNPDGHATAANPWPTYVVDLDHVAPSSLTSSNWLM
jgi:Ca2+-binding RTX toxin-like protein